MITNDDPQHNKKLFRNYGNVEQMNNEKKLYGIGICKDSEMTLIHLKICTDKYVGSRTKPAKPSSFAKNLSWNYSQKQSFVDVLQKRCS